jgi:hypothetical protein
MSRQKYLDSSGINAYPSAHALHGLRRGSAEMAITVVNKSHSATKSGPGRVHAQGHKKATPVKAKGAGIGFEQRVAPEAKRERRKVIKAIGVRQYKRRDRRGNAANVKGFDQTEAA